MTDQLRDEVAALIVDSVHRMSAKEIADAVIALVRSRDAGEVERVRAFKAYVHQRLDAAGIATHPEGSHSAAGCRIGDRLDIIVRDAERWNKFKEHCEHHDDGGYLWDAFGENNPSEWDFLIDSTHRVHCLLRKDAGSWDMSNPLDRPYCDCGSDAAIAQQAQDTNHE